MRETLEIYNKNGLLSSQHVSRDFMNLRYLHTSEIKFSAGGGTRTN
jgi:hypothetical protein